MAEPASTRLTIDLGALTHNHAVLRGQAAGAEVAPVLKADGYGLGAGVIGTRLWDDGARTFFVARLSEGEALRTALTPERPATIHVLDGFTAGSGRRLAAANLTPALSTLPQVSAAQAWAASAGRKLPVALHIDTGMNRQGLAPDEARALVQSTDRLRGLEVGLLMSHLGSAESPKNTRNIDQGVGGPQDPAILYTAEDVLHDLDTVAPGMLVEVAAEPLREVPGADRRAIDTVVLARRP